MNHRVSNLALNPDNGDLELSEPTMARSERSGLCRTFRCHIRRIDGTLLHMLARLPELSVTLQSLNGYCKERMAHMLWSGWETMVDSGGTEESVHAQASSIPWYYGSHRVRAREIDGVGNTDH